MGRELWILQRVKTADQRSDGGGELWEWRVGRGGGCWGRGEGDGEAEGGDGEVGEMED